MNTAPRVLALLLAGLACLAQVRTAEAADAPCVARSAELFRHLADMHFERARGDLSPALRQRFDTQQLAAIWTQLTDRAGAYRTHHVLGTARQGDHTVVSSRLQFARDAVDIYTACGRQGNVVDFRFVPAGTTGVPALQVRHGRIIPGTAGPVPAPASR